MLNPQPWLFPDLFGWFAQADFPLCWLIFPLETLPLRLFWPLGIPNPSGFLPSQPSLVPSLFLVPVTGIQACDGIAQFVGVVFIWVLGPLPLPSLVFLRGPWFCLGLTQLIPLGLDMEAGGRPSPTSYSSQTGRFPLPEQTFPMCIDPSLFPRQVWRGRHAPTRFPVPTCCLLPHARWCLYACIHACPVGQTQFPTPFLPKTLTPLHSPFPQFPTFPHYYYMGEKFGC